MRILPIPGYEGRYYASTEGDIYSSVKGKKKKLKPYLNERGYLKLSLVSCFGVKKTWKVHRLILFTFKRIENYKNLSVDHINNIKWDNRLSNLRWATQKENNANKKNHGTEIVGERNPKAKLNEKKIGEIKTLAKTASYSMIAELYGVSIGTIYKIVNNKSWTHLKGGKNGKKEKN